MRTILQSAWFLLAVLTVLAPPGIEAATIIFNDGGVHTISGPSDPVAVSNGTTLNIQDGAVITGGSPSISIDSTSIFSATGGSITGGGASAALSSAGSTMISGGTFQGGGEVSGGGGFGLAGTGAVIMGPATISEGTFQGGDASNSTGANILGPATISGGTFAGLRSGAAISGPATISGGTFQGVSIFPLSLVVSGSPSSPIQIQGGLFASPISLGISGGEVDFFGGLTFTGGRLTGVLADGTPLDQPVSLVTDITVLSSPGEVRFLGPNAVVPEPTSLVLLGTGLLGALGAWRLSHEGSGAAGGC